MRPIPTGLAVALLSLLAVPDARAAEPMPPLPAAVQGLRLIPGWLRDDGAHVAAIEITLAPGWHTYWRVPGANGVPPEFDWSGSGNLKAVAYEWPRPVVFDSYGEATIGYKERLTLPVVLTPARAGAPVEAALDLFFGVCKDICIPAEARLEARLDPDAPPQGRAQIERALADRPVDGAAAGVVARCSLAPGEGGGEITADIVSAHAAFGRDPTTVIEAGARSDLWIGPAATEARGDRLSAVARLDVMTGAVLDRGALRVTVLDDDRAIDIRGCAG